MHNNFTTATSTRSDDDEIVLVMIGHTCCGKTSLICTLTTNRFLSNYHGLFIDTGLKRSVVVSGQSVDAIFYEHAIDDFDPHQYTQLHQHPILFCLCVDTSQVTLRQQHEIERTAQRLKEVMPHADIILIGTKTDLRRTDSMHNMSCAEAHKFADNIQASLYIDVSARHLRPRQTLDILQRIIHVQRTHKFRQRCYDERELEALLPRKSQFNRLLYMNQQAAYDDGDANEYKDSKHKEADNHLLVGGYLRHICTQTDHIIITAAIIENVSQFIALSDLDDDDDNKSNNVSVSYYYNAADWNLLMGFAATLELKHKFYIMYGCNLCAIVLHNIGWLSFAIQLLLLSSHHALGVAALVFSTLETALIIIAHLMLWSSARVLFYTQMLSVLHVSIEIVVNLPMVCLLCIYSFTAQAALISCFYFALLTFFGFMCYKFFVIHCLFAKLNGLHKTNRYRRCSLLNWCIFLLLLVCALIVSVVFTALDIHQEIAAVITGIVLCLCLCCICVALPWLDVPSPFLMYMDSSSEIDTYAKRKLLQ